MSRSVKPLTIGLIRTRYWDRRKNQGKKIEVYSGQTYGGKDENDRVLTTDWNGFVKETFIPGGHLIHKWGKSILPSLTGPILKQHTEVIENWLSTSKAGPYRLRDDESDDFYYLAGYLVDGDKKRYVELQICSDPFNALSSNCGSEVNYYVVKDT